jgi:hypothetical protein
MMTVYDPIPIIAEDAKENCPATPPMMFHADAAATNSRRVVRRLTP